MFPAHRIPKVSLSLLLLYMIIYIVSKCFQHIEFQKFLSVYYYYIYDYIYDIQMFPAHRIPKVSLSLLLLYI